MRMFEITTRQHRYCFKVRNYYSLTPCQYLKIFSQSKWVKITEISKFQCQVKHTVLIMSKSKISATESNLSIFINNFINYYFQTTLTFGTSTLFFLNLLFTIQSQNLICNFGSLGYRENEYFCIIEVSGPTLYMKRYTRYRYLNISKRALSRVWLSLFSCSDLEFQIEQSLCATTSLWKRLHLLY